ncbi:bioY family protein [Bordetella holmesii 41130]|nr:bioY family protein [Bordetella holmesii 41130]
MTSKNLVLAALFAALIVVLSLMPPIPLPGIPVPVTLQTLGVMLAGVMLGPWRGAAACLLYLAQPGRLRNGLPAGGYCGCLCGRCALAGNGHADGPAQGCHGRGRVSARDLAKAAVASWVAWRVERVWPLLRR